MLIFICHLRIPIEELFSDDSVILYHGLFSLGGIKEMDDNTTSIDMFEELKSESFSFTRTFDQTWDIFDNQRTISPLHYSEIRDECRKGV